VIISAKIDLRELMSVEGSPQLAGNREVNGRDPAMTPPPTQYDWGLSCLAVVNFQNGRKTASSTLAELAQACTI
jgi:hypothetical protein